MRRGIRGAANAMQAICRRLAALAALGSVLFLAVGCADGGSNSRAQGDRFPRGHGSDGR